MNKFFLTVLALFFTLIANSQNIYQLDRDAGYRDLKLGATVSSLFGKIEYVEPTSSGGYKYTVTDNSYLSIFGVKMDEVFVFAYDGNVTGIYGVKRSLPGATLDSSFHERIQKGLTQKYGKPMYDMTNEHSNPPKIGVAWRTSNKEANVCTMYFKDKDILVLTVFWGMF